MFFTKQKARNLVVATGIMVLVAGCASMSESERDTTTRTLVGTAIGAAAGAAIDNGGAGGIAAGAAVGAIGGWLYDQHKKDQ